MRDANEIEFASFAEMLSCLDYSLEERNRRRLKQALTLWSRLTIWFARWYQPHRYSYVDNQTGEVYSHYRRGTRKRYARETQDEMRGQHVKKQLPPPVERVQTDLTGIRIVVSREWRALCNGFFVKVPLPLPRDAAAQNLALAILTSKFNERDEIKVTGLRRVRELCRSLGLDHNNRAEKLSRALRTVEAWFTEHGGEFVNTWSFHRGNRIAFAISEDVKTSIRKPKPKRQQDYSVAVQLRLKPRE